MAHCVERCWNVQQDDDGGEGGFSEIITGIGADTEVGLNIKGVLI